jgi:hypothetical protein
MIVSTFSTAIGASFLTFRDALPRKRKGLLVS